ncbi:MAG: DEAD/DEAH box helicase, partial [Myxococcota bacterium]
LCRAVSDAGYTTPTPIQNAGIPVVLDGRDLLGCAQTGSGKTAAFALPILDRLMRRRPERGRDGVRALVLAPTRELAAQIGDCFATYGAGSSIRHMVVFGGVSKNPQVRALRRPPEVLVACPGRLLDLMQNDGFKLRDVECVVLDEADRMLDMGFIHDVRKIVAALPKDRQNLLFSATMPAEIEKLSRSLLRNPERVAVDPISSTAGPIEQSVYFVGTKQKQSLLTHLLRGEDIGQALVFTRTKHGANRVAQKLEGADVPAAAIHGNKSQGARERAMAGFRSGAIRVVVATDLASRGIDVKHLSHVINFDLPNISETYVHRVGRTGRAGATGVAISLCSDEERPYLRDIEKLTGQRLQRLSLEGHSLPEAQPEAPRFRPRPGNEHKRPRGDGQGPGSGRPRRRRRPRR